MIRRAWSRFNQSLRRRLLLRLAALLCLLLALDAVACYYTSWHFANLVYDRWLVDSNRSLATAVHTPNGQIVVDLPQAALEVFKFDAVDITYYRIDSMRRGYIAGERRLLPIYDVPAGEVRLGNSTISGQAVRVVSGRLAPTASGDMPIVSVAETLIKRSTLTREILVVMVAPQAALLLAALLLAWINVNHGLKPLTDLAQAIEARGHDNLTPLQSQGLPSEARILASRLNELFARVSSALQAQERFVGDAAHQLRTPLASLVLHADAADAAERAGEPETRRRALHNLRIAADRAARVSQQLLVLMRAGPSAAAATHFAPLDLTALVRRLGEEWVPHMLAAGVDFGLAVPEHPVLVRADGSLLCELLSNLLDNARRYGRTEGRITLGLQLEAADSAVAYVEDDGPGIAAGELEHIFERFYRIPGTIGEGCGLGLAIVRQIAELHGAALRVDSQPDAGTTRFSITLPTAGSQTVVAPAAAVA